MVKFELLDLGETFLEIDTYSSAFHRVFLRCRLWSSIDLQRITDLKVDVEESPFTTYRNPVAVKSTSMPRCSPLRK